MLSIIICSRFAELSAALDKNINETVGVDYEIIHLDNSARELSIFSAYNKGIEMSTYPYLCFVHEDVVFHTENWGEKVVAHLLEEQKGIIGIAGSDVVTKVPGDWWLHGNNMNLIQHDKKGKKKEITIPVDYRRQVREVVVVDGVFLCMRKNLASKIPFNEQLEGFHGYDYDMSFRSISAGYRNFVVYDIWIEHFSNGKKNKIYYQNLISIFRKWNYLLPLAVNFPVDEQVIVAMDKAKLGILIPKILKRGLSYDDALEMLEEHAANCKFYSSPLQQTVYLFSIRLFKPFLFWMKWYYR